VEGAQELGDEERQETALAQELELTGHEGFLIGLSNAPTVLCETGSRRAPGLTNRHDGPNLRQAAFPARIVSALGKAGVTMPRSGPRQTIFFCAHKICVCN